MSDHIVSYWTQFRRDKNETPYVIFVGLKTTLHSTMIATLHFWKIGMETCCCKTFQTVWKKKNAVKFENYSF